MKNITDQQIKAIQAACKARSVVNLYVFGSVLTQDFNAESDIDLLVEFEDQPPEDYADNYFDLCDDLEKILVRKVDLLTLRSIRNPFFKSQVFNARQQLFPA